MRPMTRSSWTRFRTLLGTSIGSVVAIYLVLLEAPTIHYCEWFQCSVVAPFNWHQPVLFTTAFLLLGSALWNIANSHPLEEPLPFGHDQSLPFVEAQTIQQTMLRHDLDTPLPPTKFYFIDYVADGGFSGG